MGEGWEESEQTGSRIPERDAVEEIVRGGGERRKKERKKNKLELNDCESKND